jgi:hypothetical protein
MLLEGYEADNAFNDLICTGHQRSSREQQVA